MKIELWSIGSPSPGHLQEVEKGYLKRLKPFAPVSFHILRNTRVKFRDPELIKKEEGKLIRSRLKDRNARVVLLDEFGKTMSSIEFSQFLEGHLNHYAQDLIFIIGGAYGFAPDIQKAAQYKLSLSQLTFPHQLVRSIFLEQLYRGFSILKNLPYHHQ